MIDCSDNKIFSGSFQLWQYRKHKLETARDDYWIAKIFGLHVAGCVAQCIVALLDNCWGLIRL